MRNMRYYLEDKPQYLDDPEGEYWFEKKGNGGRLYLRLPGDTDPNAAQINLNGIWHGLQRCRVRIHQHLAFISFDERFTLTDDTVQFQYAPPADWSHCRYCSSTRLAGWCERQTESSTSHR